MMSARHLAGQTRVCGCQLQSRRVQARTGRRCTTIRAATAVPAEYKTVSPVGDRVYVKVDVSEEKTSSGLLLPVSAQKKPTQGEIVGAGTAKAVKNGDKVVYSKYAGTELKVEGADYVLLKEDDVIGVLNSTDIAQLLPLGDRILIEIADVEDTTEGGLLMAGSSKEKPTLGTVVAVGSGKANEKGDVVKPTLGKGDTVLYQKYSGVDFEGENERQYVVLKENDILAALA
ncbi:hypothetical protein WJX79_003516 [Trebouxia sp. C0005]|nr:MAG: 20 kDa chloroplastic-like [Trebouxia sp. A1-2]